VLRATPSGRPCGAQSHMRLPAACRAHHGHHTAAADRPSGLLQWRTSCNGSAAAATLSAGLVLLLQDASGNKCYRPMVAAWAEPSAKSCLLHGVPVVAAIHLAADLCSCIPWAGHVPCVCDLAPLVRLLTGIQRPCVSQRCLAIIATHGHKEPVGNKTECVSIARTGACTLNQHPAQSIRRSQHCHYVMLVAGFARPKSHKCQCYQLRLACSQEPLHCCTEFPSACSTALVHHCCSTAAGRLCLV
jgi:hypothetical protein